MGWNTEWIHFHAFSKIGIIGYSLAVLCNEHLNITINDAFSRKDTENWLNFYTAFLKYSQIWVNHMSETITKQIIAQFPPYTNYVQWQRNLFVKLPICHKESHAISKVQHFLNIFQLFIRWSYCLFLSTKAKIFFNKI